MKKCFRIRLSLLIIKRSRSIFSILLFITLSGGPAFSQPEVHKMEPAFWWTGMKNRELQIMVYGKDLKGASVQVTKGKVRITGVEEGDSPNYLFVNLVIPETQAPGKIELSFGKGKDKVVQAYELKARRAGSSGRTSFTPADVVYLVMPDRFANGDSTNDSDQRMAERVNRKSPNGRHGGDIQGITGKLDYLKDLGVTAVWNTPLWEDNAPANSYHGYAATDFYKIDPRYGSNDEYVLLAAACHSRHLKLIMDVVPNHCSIYHPWLSDLPTRDWIHVQPAKYKRSLSISAWTDPYVSDIDYVLNKDGWFTEKMPDLNQDNKKVLKYLIQNTIWWIESADLDGLRVDTYPYSEKQRIAEWTKAITDEYPAFNIVGEVWQSNTASVAYWQKDAYNADHYNSHLPAVMDFPLMEQMWESFNEDSTKRDKGIRKLHSTLGMDYLYANRDNIMTFLDNHDTERFGSVAGNDIGLVKLGYTFLLTTRGIPQIYYGSEILASGGSANSGNRPDFPGGWLTDSRNAFSDSGRTITENELFHHIQRLLLWRKNSPVVWKGKLKHFKPENSLYVYFRYDDHSRVMVLLNNSGVEKKVDTFRYEEMLKGYSSGKDVITGKEFRDLHTIPIGPKSGLVLELR